MYIIYIKIINYSKITGYIVIYTLNKKIYITSQKFLVCG